MTVLSRKTVREAFATAIGASVAGVGLPVQVVYNHMPSTLDGQSPVLLVLSSGTQRQPRGMGAKTWDNTFYFEMHILVYDGADNPLTDSQREDKVDEIEALAADWCVKNQVSATWRSLEYTPDGPTDITVTKFFDGKPYRLEVVKVRVEAPDA